ncbi:hypothetical protein M1271_04055 [Patescibacteria group bacterium]|nr:hypothetical protein [Patescibacteria group bacterium]
MADSVSKKSDYSIGVVTFLDRYEETFKKLAIDLARYFPDVEKNVILNGFPDKNRQLKYLKEATGFLSGLGFNHVLTFETHQSLARGWNLLVILSSKSKVLILNDDCLMGPGFRKEFETQKGNRDWIFINESYSHFMTSKNVVRKVGWFDERFKGIGHEDGDFSRRCALAGYPYDVGIDCPTLKNLKVESREVSYLETDNNNKKGFLGKVRNYLNREKSGRSGNYSTYNEYFFRKKWKHADRPLPGYTLIPIRHLKKYRGIKPGAGAYCKLAPGMETPLFYPLDILN